jgi:lipoprotein-anchoring transpeptidase ErfK/SrfK
MCTINYMGYKKNKKNRKTVGHYLRIYFLSLFLSLAIFAGGYFLKPQIDCANSKTCKSDLSVNIDNSAIGIFQGRKITPPKIDLAKELLESAVLGVRVSNDEKHIYVDLSTQTLYAYEGSKKIMQVLISSGKWGRTPTGNFNIWTKLRATRMAGGQGQDAYDLPNVPWVMYYYNDFGLHGAYWHNNFGYPMSHGCVNMRPVDAKELYSWADGPTSGQKGTAVSICDQFVAPNKCIQDS